MDSCSMKIYKAKVLDRGGCFHCGCLNAEGEYNVDCVNIIEIAGHNIIHEIRLCDRCAVELRKLLGDIE